MYNVSLGNDTFSGRMEGELGNLYERTQELAVRWFDDIRCRFKARIGRAEYKPYANRHRHVWPREMPVLLRTIRYSRYNRRRKIYEL